MKRIICVILSVLLLSAQISYAEELKNNELNIYVSPSGTDMSKGSFAQPFATLKKAKEKARELKNKNPGKQINVIFREGIYRFNDTVNFSEKDSGQENAKIVYTSYPGENVEFTTSLKISVLNFGQVTDKKVLNIINPCAKNFIGVYSLKNSGITEMEKFAPAIGYGSWRVNNGTQAASLFLNNREQTLARYPNGEAQYLPVGNTVSKSIIGYSGNKADNWKNAPNPVIIGGLYKTWTYEMCSVDFIDTVSKQIHLKNPAWGGIDKAGTYCVTNLLEELDIPGEFYIDEENLLLYFYPPYSLKADDSLEVTINNNDILNLENASYIEFRNINFNRVRNNGISIDNCKDIEIINCEFSNITCNGIWIENSYDCTVEECNFMHIGATGVSLDGGDRIRILAGNNKAVNCYFYDFARKVKTYSPAVRLDGVGNTVKNCTIHASPHQAIGFSGKDHKILYNEIYDCVRECTDAGAIYCCRSIVDHGVEIAYNYIHDIVPVYKDVGHYARGIYLDDAYSGVSIHHNVLYNVEQAMIIGGGILNHVNNNIIINSKVHTIFEDRGSGWMMNVGKSMLKKGLDIVRENSAYAKYDNLEKTLEMGCKKNILHTYNSTVINNLFYNEPEPVIAQSYYDYGTVKNNITLIADSENVIGFEKEKERDFTIKEGSEILYSIPGLSGIDVKNAGIYAGNNRRSVKFSMGDFRAYYPENNSVEISNKQIYASWEQSDHADRYKILIAEDKEFKNITNEFESIYNYIYINNLTTSKRQQYWKIEAISDGFKNNETKESKGGAFTFRTTLKYDADKSQLENTVKKAEAFVEGLKEGSDAGCVKKGTVENINYDIAHSKQILGRNNVPQNEIDDANYILKKNLDISGKYAHKFYTGIDFLFEKADSWYHKDENAKIIIENGNITHISPYKMSVATYTDKPVNKNKILCFNLNMNMGENFWTGIGFQNTSSSGDFIWRDHEKNGVLIVFKKNLIELQIWNKDGNIIKPFKTDLFKPNEDNYIETGIINFGFGNRLILNINGISVFDEIDYGSLSNEEMYFSLYTGTDSGNETTAYISKSETIPKNEIYTEGISDSGLQNVSAVFGVEKESSVSKILNSQEKIPYINMDLSIKRDSENKFVDFYMNLPDGVAEAHELTGYKINISDNSIILSKYKDGKVQILSASNSIVPKNKWCRIKIRQRCVPDGLNIQLKKDDDTVFDVTDIYPVRTGENSAITVDGGNVLIK